MGKQEARVVEFTLPYPPTPAGKKEWAKEFSLNSIYSGQCKGHYSIRSQKKHEVAWSVVAELRRQDVRKKLFERPVRITFYWHDGLDIDNHAFYAKMVVDALKGYLLNNDSPRWYKAVAHEFHDEDCILIRLEEI
jgi:hypothetical protein